MTSTRHSTRAPGPRGMALWHSLRYLRRDPLGAYQALRAQFGDTVRLSALPYPVYLLSHPDAAQHVLRDNAANYRKGLLFKPIAALQGQGLLTSEGEHWLRQRRLVQPAFHRRQIATFAEVMSDEARTVVQEWRHAGQTGTPVNVAERMQRLTFNVVGRVLLGVAPDALDEYSRQLKAIALQLLQHMNTRATSPWALPGWIPTPVIGSSAEQWRSTTPSCSRSSRPVGTPCRTRRSRRRICWPCCWPRVTRRQGRYERSAAP